MLIIFLTKKNEKNIESDTGHQILLMKRIGKLSTK